MEPLLADATLKPGPKDMDAAREGVLDLLRLRLWSPLFRLGSAGLVQERVSFPHGGPDQVPGVIVMEIDDRGGADLDPGRERIVVVFNAIGGQRSVDVEDAGALQLHQVQAGGADETVKETEIGETAVTVPARTVAVLEQP